MCLLLCSSWEETYFKYSVTYPKVTEFYKAYDLMGKTTHCTTQWFTLCSGHAIVTQNIIAHFSSLDHYKSTYGKPFLHNFFKIIFHIARSNSKSKYKCLSPIADVRFKPRTLKNNKNRSIVTEGETWNYLNPQMAW